MQGQAVPERDRDGFKIASNIQPVTRYLFHKIRQQLEPEIPRLRFGICRSELGASVSKASALDAGRTLDFAPSLTLTSARA